MPQGPIPLTQEADKPDEEAGQAAGAGEAGDAGATRAAGPDASPRPWSAYEVWFTRVHLPRRQQRVVVIDESAEPETDPSRDPAQGLSGKPA